MLISVRLLQPCGIVSIVFSGSVLLTVAVFPSMVTNKIFMQLVALISLADLLGNWPYALSFYPNRGNWLCFIESICNLLCFPVGWLLTAVLTKLFRDVLIEGRVSLSRTFIGIICLGVPIILTLLYLAFWVPSIGGQSGSGTNETICAFFASASTMPAIRLYHEISYDGLLYACILYMFVMIFQVLRYEYNNENRSGSKAYQLVKRVVILYPFALICCWTPHAVCVFVNSCNFNAVYTDQTNTIKILHGAVVAIIFFTMSPEARNKWYGLIFSKKDENRPLVTSISIESSIMDSTLPDDDSLFDLMNSFNERIEAPYSFDKTRLSSSVNDIHLRLDSSENQLDTNNNAMNSRFDL